MLVVVENLSATLLKMDADDARDDAKNGTQDNGQEHLEIHESNERHCTEEKEESADCIQNFVQHGCYSFVFDWLWKYCKCCYC